MKSLIVVGAVLVSSTNACAQSQEDWIVLRQLAASVMQIQAMVDGNASIASAVGFTSQLAVTNCHVVGASLDARLMRGPLSTPATLKVRDSAHDICLLGVEASPAFVPNIGRAEALNPGDKVYAVGFGMGRLTTSVGKVEALYRYEGSVVVRISAAFSMGASGGGLFDSNRRLVGILTFYRHGHEAHAYYALPIEWATQLATSTETGLTSAYATPFWELPGDMQPFFLQVAGHEIDGEWNKMLKLSERWVAAEPGNVEAKRALELARGKLR